MAEGLYAGNAMPTCPECGKLPSWVGGNLTPRDALCWGHPVTAPSPAPGTARERIVNRSPLRGAEEMWVNEEWRQAVRDESCTASLRCIQFDPDDWRVRVRPVQDDNDLLNDVAALRAHIARGDAARENAVRQWRHEADLVIRQVGELADLRSTLATARARLAEAQANVEALRRPPQQFPDEHTQVRDGGFNEALDAVLALLAPRPTSGGPEPTGEVPDGDDTTRGRRVAGDEVASCDCVTLRARLTALRAEQRAIAALFHIEPCVDDRPSAWRSRATGTGARSLVELLAIEARRITILLTEAGETRYWADRFAAQAVSAIALAEQLDAALTAAERGGGGSGDVLHASPVSDTTRTSQREEWIAQYQDEPGPGAPWRDAQQPGTDRATAERIVTRFRTSQMPARIEHRVITATIIEAPSDGE